MAANKEFDFSKYSEDEELFIKLEMWFESKIQELKRISELDDDHELVVQDGEGNQITIEADLKKGLKIGCSLAIDVFGEFPLEIK